MNTAINLELSVDQVNQILSALGQRPYQEVYELVETIQQQAGPQLEALRETADSDAESTGDIAAESAD